MMKINNLLNGNKNILWELSHGIILFILIIITNSLSFHLGVQTKFIPTFTVSISNALPFVPAALGVGYVISSKEIDLSYAGVFSFSTLLILLFQNSQQPVYFALITVFILILVIGFLVGYSISFLGVNSIILTLGLSFLLYGFSFYINRDVVKGVYSLTDSYKLPVFNHIEVIVLLIILLFYLLRFTQYWKCHIAVGLNQDAARLCNLNTRIIKLMPFLISSILCLLSALLLMFYYSGGGDVGTGKGIELIVIAIALIGGTKITGGYFQPVNILLAAILWYSFHTLVTFDKDIPTDFYQLYVGILIIIFSFIRSYQSKKIRRGP